MSSCDSEERSSIVLEQIIINTEEALQETQKRLEQVICDQNWNQRSFLFMYVSIEIYRLVISTLLILFVPQDCSDRLSIQRVCTLSQNMSPDNLFYLGGLIVNYITLGFFLVLYVIEIIRELNLIHYLEVSKDKPFDNVSVGAVFDLLPASVKHNIYYLDTYYQKLGYFCCVLFLCNTALSGVIISHYSLGSQTYESFATNILFMATKIYHIYYVVSTDKNVLFSAYLVGRLQYNDIDPVLKKKIEISDRINI